MLLLATHLARDAGRRHQDRLWARWGGAPTLRRLRYRGADHPDQVAALHGRVEQALGTALPDRDAEEADAERADVAYNDAIRRLRSRTRDDRKRFRLVFEENVNYGFRRNLRGSLSGLGIAGTVLAVCVAAFLFGDGTVDERLRAWSWPACIAIVEALFWLIVVKDDWVRLPARSTPSGCSTPPTRSRAGAVPEPTVPIDSEVPSAADALRDGPRSSTQPHSRRHAR